MSVRFKQLRDTLDCCDTKYRLLSLQNNYCLLISEDAGRLYGPFDAEDSCGIAWIPREMASPESWRKYCAANWNRGGDRAWIAPEFPFFVKDRKRFNESYTVQEGIDPGHYRFAEAAKDSVMLEAKLKAELYESTFPEKRLGVRRSISPCRNPLLGSDFAESMMDCVRYCGFTQTLDYRDDSPEYPMDLEIWNLFQLRAGGEFLLPYMGKTFEYVDYYTPSGGRVLFVEPGVAHIRVKSSAEHKIGAKAYQTFGRIGYILQNEEDSWCLLVRNYYNNPSDACAKEPSNQPGKNGCSLFVYMNDTRGDGFTELETTGPTFRAPETPNSTLDLNYWFFTGPLCRINDIARVLLNAEYAPAE